MFKYPKVVINPKDEPEIPPPSQRRFDTIVPVEDEVRYLGNVWNYCGSFHKELKDCVEGEILSGNNFVFKACKNSLDELHNCYLWREPSESKYEERFLTENQECLLERDTFLKCYMKQGEPWEKCHNSWTDIYRCKYRKNPSTYNIN